jgi:hypothetical protein
VSNSRATIGPEKPAVGRREDYKKQNKNASPTAIVFLNKARSLSLLAEQ